ncbi:MAG: hypothetical protein WC783_00595 [Candidatus Paceibacterota bacterium]|jgi:NTP pyrophosphatase (non-canonical NTP hydrolase)
MKAINEWVKEIHQTAVDKGWWEDPVRRPLEIHALIHSEIAEATEAYRENIKEIYIDIDGKPEGEAIELADTVIRIMDYFGYMGWNLEKAIELKTEFNKTRSKRHGGKKA